MININALILEAFFLSLSTKPFFTFMNIFRVGLLYITDKETKVSLKDVSVGPRGWTGLLEDNEP